MSRSEPLPAAGRTCLVARVAVGLALPALLPACRQDMYDQPRYDPLERSDLFADKASARHPPKGTVTRADPRADKALWSGVDATGGFAARAPMEIGRAQLQRGRERFGIHCTPCHGFLGDGNGMIVQRGFKRPTSFHTDRLRSQPIGYFVDVITNGFGVMPSYADRVPPEDRWAIAAYVGALQLSQSARRADLPPEDAARVDAALRGQPAAPAEEGR